ncbi:MAG: serine hydrolase [Spirochaetia bacterium]
MSNSLSPIFFLWLIAFPLFLMNAQVVDLDLHARSAILIDATTGTILYEKDADIAIPPASLTKVMTLYLAYQALADGRFNYGSPMMVSTRADFRNQEKGSSIMYLETGQRPTLYDLMLGLAIASGNDAAVALAENFSGNIQSFVRQMNRQAKAWNLENVNFVDPSGIGEKNSITAREFSVIAMRYIQDFPQSLSELHKVEQMVYPRRENWALKGRKWHNSFVNKTPLLGKFDGLDGLKTGYIRESGYNLVSTAQRGETRLIGVLLGVNAPGVQTGDRRRQEDMRRLFEYGFEHFETIEIGSTVLKIAPQMHVFGGQKRSADFYAIKPRYVTVEKGKLPFSLKEIERLDWFVCAPLKAGVGVKKEHINISVLGKEETIQLEFASKESIRRAPFLLWLEDYSTYLFKRVFS